MYMYMFIALHVHVHVCVHAMYSKCSSSVLLLISASSPFSLAAAKGLRHLRTHNFVHRDIKPGNIMRCGNPDGRSAAHTASITDKCSTPKQYCPHNTPMVYAYLHCPRLHDKKTVFSLLIMRRCVSKQLQNSYTCTFSCSHVNVHVHMYVPLS